MIIVLSRKDDTQSYLLHAEDCTYEDIEKCIGILHHKRREILETFTVDMIQEAE